MGDGQSSADAVPAEAAALGDRFGLGRYESALTRETYSPAREWGRRLPTGVRASRQPVTRGSGRTMT